MSVRYVGRHVSRAQAVTHVGALVVHDHSRVEGGLGTPASPAPPPWRPESTRAPQPGSRSPLRWPLS
eukprot:8902457-Pyramimonas_sp.AAC.1